MTIVRLFVLVLSAVCLALGAGAYGAALLLPDIGPLGVSLVCLAALGLAATCSALGLAFLFRPVSGLTLVARLVSSGDLSGAGKTLAVLSGPRKEGGLPRLFLRPDNEIGGLMAAFSAMVEDLGRIVAEVKTAGRQVASSVGRITSSAGEFESSVAQQAASTNEVSATSRQISATSQALVSTMDRVGRNSSDTAALAAAVQENVAGREKNLEDLIAATGNVSARLSAINDKATKINDIVTTIAGIADQTNLLSLNAAIEAEKAGQYGKGFSVVAREIRRLADQTVIAAEDIELMVGDMHAAVSAGVLEMEAFTGDVRASVQEVVRIGSTLEEIMDRVRELGPLFEEVARGVRTQSESADEISKAMEGLAETARRTADSIAEFKRVTAGMSYTVRSLDGAAERFRTEDGETLPEQDFTQS